MLKSILGGYLSVIENKEKIDLNRIRVADFKHIAPLLKRAAELRLAALEFFTMKEFVHSSACLVLLDKKSLAEVDGAFDLHGLWMTRAAGASNENEPITMEFFLLGHGKLVVGYPKEAWVRVPDYEIQAHYMPYTSMRIEHQKTRRALSGIRTLATRDAEFEGFEALAPLFWGLLEVPIQITSLTTNGDSILVSYRALGGEREDRRPKIAISERCGFGCAK